MHAQFPTDHISHAPTLHPNDRPGRQECAIKKKDYKNGDARTRTATRGVHCRLQSVCPCRCARARNRVAKNLQERAGVGSVRSVEVEKPSEGRSGKHAERGDELESAKPRRVQTNRVAGLDVNVQELRPISGWCGARSRTRVMERDK